MMQIVSEEESRRWKAEVQRLHASESLEDRVMAILMDLEIGQTGEDGEAMRAKARAICDLMNLQVDGMKKFAGVLAQKIHDLCNHPRSIQFCESTVCQDHLERLGITEKLKHEEPHPPRAEGDLAPPGDAAGYAASASAPARLVSHCSGSACSNSWNRNCICICAKCEDAKARDH